MALCSALLAGDFAASAQTSDDEYARRHFESGAAYLQQSNYDDALREFQAAYSLSKRPQLLLNIANVYERLGKLREAIDALTQYLGDDPKSVDRTTIETRIANLKKRLDTAPPVASASPVPTADRAAPPSSAASTASPAPSPATPRHPANRAPAYIGFGVGGAAAIGAVVTGLLANGKFHDAETSCKPNCPDDTVSSVKSMALVSDILTGVAVVGVGAGAVLFLTAMPPKEPAASRTPSLNAGLGPSGGKIEATWHF